MTYDLRRLRLHGFIERSKGTQRYRVSEAGLGAASFCSRLYGRCLCPGLAALLDNTSAAPPALRRPLPEMRRQIDALIEEENLVALAG